MQENQPLGIYIHIPYCQRKCHYCDFLTFINRDDTIDQYITYLLKEIELYGQGQVVDTIYFGGGTPSYIDSRYIVTIVEKIREVFHVQSDCEISIEMNPESVEREKLMDYQSAGINRYSMGVQSFNDAVLKLMGRVHRRQTVLDKLQLMEELGFEKIGIDLMFGNPKQSFDVLKEDIAMIEHLPINHISCYSLMVKPHTPLARWVETGQITLIDDEEERDMYHYIQRQLAEYGFHQYEISNFAKGDHESRHNQKYWRLQDYLGFGLGASSNIGLVRYQNVSQFNAYFEALDRGEKPIHFEEKMNLEERELEYIMLHMRLLQGFSIEAFNQRFHTDFLTKYQKAIDKHLHYQTIEIHDGRVQFTPKGLDIGNQFYLDIL